ncbi:hypothetical protein SHIRM173S_09762 [Streptomyces hirsutus]
MAGRAEPVPAFGFEGALSRCWVCECLMEPSVRGGLALRAWGQAVVDRPAAPVIWSRTARRTVVSARLFGYFGVRCSTTGMTWRRAAPQERSLSVTTTRGTYSMSFKSRRKNPTAARVSRLDRTRTSSTFPCWSTARHR